MMSSEIPAQYIKKGIAKIYNNARHYMKGFPNAAAAGGEIRSISKRFIRVIKQRIITEGMLENFGLNAD